MAKKIKRQNEWLFNIFRLSLRDKRQNEWLINN
jgi:hypothetical protein